VVDLFFDTCGLNAGDHDGVIEAAEGEGLVWAPQARIGEFRAHDQDMQTVLMGLTESSVPVLLSVAIEPEWDESLELTCRLETFVESAPAILAELETRTDDRFPYGREQFEDSTVTTWTANSLKRGAMIHFQDRGDLSGFILSLSAPLGD
jgi:hypothetical protein